MKNSSGEMVPVNAVVKLERVYGLETVTCNNLFNDDAFRVRCDAGEVGAVEDGILQRTGVEQDLLGKQGHSGHRGFASIPIFHGPGIGAWSLRQT